jgi:hypothetical protein
MNYNMKVVLLYLLIVSALLPKVDHFTVRYIRSLLPCHIWKLAWFRAKQLLLMEGKHAIRYLF